MSQSQHLYEGGNSRQGWWQQHWSAAAMVILIFVGAVMRFWALDHLPPGIYRDEAYEGLDALQVLNGKLSLFFTANNGREPLFVYLLSPFVAVLGRSAFALRLLPALTGVLLIPATYALGCELLGRKAGVFAAALAACSVWALNLSRLALRATLLPLIAALLLTCLMRGLRLHSLKHMLGAGLLLAFGFYTYLAARFMLIAVGLFAAWLLLRQRRAFWWQGWLALLLVLLAVTAPLALYYCLHPTDFWGRSSQVSIFNPLISQGQPLRALLTSAWHTLLGFFYRGDFIPRHDIPNRPFLEPLNALAFAGGLVVLGRYQRRRGNAFLVYIWLVLLSLPTILAEGAPHMLRAVGLVPVLYLPAAAGLAWFSDHLRPVKLSWLGTALVLVALGQTGCGAMMAYSRHLNSEDVYYNFESGAAELASTIKAHLASSRSRSVLLDKRLWDNYPSLQFLLGTNPNLTVLNVDDASSLQVANDGRDGLLLVLWPFTDNSPALRLLPSNQVISVTEGTYERGDLETEARLLYVSYESIPSAGQAPAIEAAWEHGITLVAHTVAFVDQETLMVELRWLAQQAPGEAYTVYVHLVGDDVLIAQHDGPPCQGYYGTERWRAGDIVIDRHYLHLAQPCDLATAKLVLGLYHWPEMMPLVRTDSAGAGFETYVLPVTEAQAVP